MNLTSFPALTLHKPVQHLDTKLCPTLETEGPSLTWSIWGCSRVLSLGRGMNPGVESPIISLRPQPIPQGLTRLDAPPPPLLSQQVLCGFSLSPSAQLQLLFRPELHGSPPGPSSVSIITPMDQPSLPRLWPQTRTAQRVGGIYNPMISSQGRVLSMALHSILFYPLCSEQPLKGPFKRLGMLGRKGKMQVGS